MPFFVLCGNIRVGQAERTLGMTKRAKRVSKKNKVEKTIIFGLLLSNLVLGGMYYESNQQLTEMKNHYNYSNELNEELYDELNDVSRELEEQIYKTNSLEKELLNKELEEKKEQETSNKGQNRKQVISCHVTAYTVGDAYTPSDTMANGEKVHVGAVASYDLPLGTKVRINGVVYTVKDRCGAPDTLDIYMNSKQECVSFGKRYMEVEIL